MLDNEDRVSLLHIPADARKWVTAKATTPVRSQMQISKIKYQNDNAKFKI